MRPHRRAALFAQRHGALHHQRIACMEATGHIGRCDKRDHLFIHSDGIRAKAFAQVTVQINIWSTYKGKFEINSIANRVIVLLQTKQIDLSEDEFLAVRQQVDFFEAYPEEETGYNGVISLIMLIQNLQRSES